MATRKPAEVQTPAPPPADPPANPPAAQTPPAATVKARVLADGAWGRINTVVEVSALEAAAGQAAGELDTDPAAIAACEPPPAA